MIPLCSTTPPRWNPRTFLKGEPFHTCTFCRSLRAFIFRTLSATQKFAQVVFRHSACSYSHPSLIPRYHSTFSERERERDGERTGVPLGEIDSRPRREGRWTMKSRGPVRWIRTRLIPVSLTHAVEQIELNYDGRRKKNPFSNSLVDVRAFVWMEETDFRKTNNLTHCWPVTSKLMFSKPNIVDR